MVTCWCTKCKPFLFNFDMKRLNLRLEASVVGLAGHFFHLFEYAVSLVSKSIIIFIFTLYS
jgi:hypothetical protein